MPEGPGITSPHLLDEGTLVNGSREKRRQKTLELGKDFPVRTGLLKIRAYHQLRQTTGVARLIANFIREMRLEELDLAENRPREVWRRRRFLGEQARQLEYVREANPGTAPLTLNMFLQWADMQQEEGTRINDFTAPEADDDAVRIMTMHAAKGLEFPIVILLGLELDPSINRETVLFDSRSGSTEVKLGSLQTPGYSTLEEHEKVHDAAELVAPGVRWLDPRPGTSHSKYLSIHRPRKPPEKRRRRADPQFLRRRTITSRRSVSQR